MASLSTAMQVAHKQTIAGVEYRFARLTLGDLANMSQDVVNKRKMQAIALASDPQTKLTRLDLAGMLQEISDRIPTVDELFRMAATAVGAAEVIKASMLKAGHTAEEVAKAIHDWDAASIVALAADLIGCDPVKPEVQPESPLASASAATPPVSAAGVAPGVVIAEGYGAPSKSSIGTTTAT